MKAINRYIGLASLVLSATGCGGEESELVETEPPTQVEAGAEPEAELALTNEEAVALSDSAIANPVVTLQVRQTGLCLDIEGASKENGAVLRQYPCYGGANQKFQLRPEGDNSYSLVALHSDKCLDIKEQSNESGARVHQWSCHGGRSQQFRLRSDGGYHWLVVRKSDKCVEAENTYPLPKARVQQSRCKDTPTQLFKIKKQ